jgi:hypothetical protein
MHGMPDNPMGGGMPGCPLAGYQQRRGGGPGIDGAVVLVLEAQRCPLWLAPRPVAGMGQAKQYPGRRSGAIIGGRVGATDGCGELVSRDE